jgi:tetratricopeptide (TPR) repeat protein
VTGGGEPGQPEGAALRIEPVVSRPRTARAGHAYLVTVDLRGGGPGSAWPYEEEEFGFGVALDGQPLLTCEALGHPSVVLHRFGDTYGPARFLVTAGAATGLAELRLTISNGWGVPVRTAVLQVEVLPEGPDREPPTVRVPGPGGSPAEGDVPEPRPAGRPVPDAGPVREQQPVAPGHVTVSFAGCNRAWAIWAADVLERHGVRAVPQRMEFPPDAALADGLRDLLLAPGRVLLVLSEWYLRLWERTEQEWEDALRDVVAAHPERFVAVTVTGAELPFFAASGADLSGLDAAEAGRRLLGLLGLDPAADGGARAPDHPRYPLDPPEVRGGVPPRNTRFIGRSRLLSELHATFQQAASGAAVVTLHGLTGVGKTHLATEYAHLFGSEYDVVWWVRAAERGTLREKLAGLAPALGLVTGSAYGERLRAVHNALRRGEPYTRWLVVLDGADQPEDVYDLVPTGPGHVLITSQNRGWSEYNSALVEVPVYDRAESVAFVRRRAPRLDAADADKLAEALGDHALALDQNAGALDDTDIPVDDHLARLGRGAGPDDGLRIADDFRMTYHRAFLLLLDRLREDRPEAVHLLRLCAFFAPGPVPLRLLRAAADVPDLPDELAALLGDPGVWADTVHKLAKWSVLQTDPPDLASAEAAGGAETAQLHPLVHRSVRSEMRESEQAGYARVVRAVLAAADPGQPDDPRTWPGFAEIVPHLAASGALDGRDPRVRDLVLHCLRYLSQSGEYTVGLDLSRRALAAWRSDEDGAGPDPGIWDLVHHHGNLLRGSGDYAATEVSDREAWTRLSAERGAEHPDALRAAAGLAADLRGLGRYDEAEEFSGHVARATLAARGPDHPLTLIADNNHAVSLRLLGRYAEALDVDRATLRARSALHGPDHRWTLLSEVACTEDLWLLGRHAEAAEQQRGSYGRHRAVLGPDHPRTLRAGQLHALCLAAGGDTEAAGGHLVRLLERAERVLGPAHPYTVIGRSLYASHQRAHGDLDRARGHGEQVLDQYRDELGEAHPYAAGALCNHALVLGAAGEHAAARDAAARALVAMNGAVGADHPWTLGCTAAALALAPPDPGIRATLTARSAARLGPRHPLTRACAEGGSWDFEPLTT